MKKCPQCGRDYNDPTLSFCLDDGSALLDGPASSDEPATAILPDSAATGEAPTLTLDPSGTEETKLFRDKPGTESPRKTKVIAGIAGIFAVAALAIGGYWYFGRGSAKQFESIAVMPFANETGEADLEYLSDGMTETLINSLSRIPDLSVKSRSSVFSYKRKSVKAADVAGDLQVSSILSGRISKQGDRIVLSLELVDPATDTVLWGNNYERDPSQLVRLQSEIARDVAIRLKSRLSAPSDTDLTKEYTSDPAAYQDYLKGRFYWYKRTRDDIARSVDFFNAALEKDPEYALAYSGLAQSYVIFPNYGVAPAKESLPKARRAAEKALEIDDSLAEAHAALGLYYMNYAWNPEKAEEELREAIALKPDYALAYHWLNVGPLSATGRHDEAIAAGDRAVELEPLSLILIMDAADSRAYARRYDEAIAGFKAALEMDPNFPTIRSGLGDAYLSKGDYARAIEQYRKFLELGDTPFAQAELARALAKNGEKKEALEIFGQLKERAGKEYVSPFILGLVYGALGDLDSGFEMMDKAFDERSFYLVHLRNPWLDDFRKDPRFDALRRRVEEARID